MDEGGEPKEERMTEMQRRRAFVPRNEEERLPLWRTAEEHVAEGRLPLERFGKTEQGRVIGGLLQLGKHAAILQNNCSKVKV